MGLFRRENKWTCQRCGANHKSNPEECKNCGHTVLQQFRSEPEQASRETGTRGDSTQTSTQTSSRGPKWVCMRCKQSHDYEPEKCKVCGRTEFRASGTDPKREQEAVTNGPSTEESTTGRDGPEPGEEGVSFSNISEIREWEQKQSEESDSPSGSSVLLLVLLLVALVVVAVFLL